MKVTMMLCDAAQVAEGKLFVLGGGWSVTGPDPTPSAIALLAEVSPRELPRSHHLELRLFDEDGRPVFVRTADGDEPVEIRADFETTTGDGVPDDGSIAIPFAFNIGPIPLERGARYAWELVVDGETHPDWRATFTTRSAPPESWS